MFGDKTYGESKEALDPYVAESIQQYSEEKERKGKTAEEQVIDQISSQLITVLLSQSDQTDKSLIARLTKHKQGAAAIQIKGIVNNQLGFPYRQKTRKKNSIDTHCKNECRGKTLQQQEFIQKVEEDIFDYIPPQKTILVFTPKWVIKEMADLLEKENPGCFDNPQKTFADLYMESGQYITGIVKRLYNSNGLCKAFPDKEARIQHIFRHRVYGLAPTECIYRIAINYILDFNDTIHSPESEYLLRMADSLPAAKNGTMEQFL